MKNFRFSTKLMMGAAIACALSLSVTSCSDDDDDDPAPVANNGGGGSSSFTTVNVSGDISSDVTWTADKVYFLASRVIVKNGATLTIEAGTIIKGNPGAEANAKPLVIAKGAKIRAMGTAAKPIIFTSAADNIVPGQITGTNLGANDRGLWAGLIILGDAPTSSSSGATDRIEGIPASIPEGIYGGSNAADNSGELHYVSIRHGGVELIPGGGNEINGLTMGGVGNGTVMDHIEVVANLDDAFEWFGGTVDMDHAIAAFQGDDAFDIDQAYSGTIRNIAYIQGPDSDHAFEIDGPEGSLSGSFTIDGGSLYGDPNGTKGEYADFRDGALGTIQNIYFNNFGSNADVEIDDAVSEANYIANTLSMTGCVFNTTRSLADIANNTNNPAAGGFDFDAEFTNDNSIGTSAPSGFDKSQFTGWTWADANGYLSNL